jgi:hypothetical protein
MVLGTMSPLARFHLSINSTLTMPVVQSRVLSKWNHFSHDKVDYHSLALTPQLTNGCL